MSDKNNKREIFETMPVNRALAVMAFPTILSQLITLVYNMTDTWFIGRTNNPYMVGAAVMVATIFLMVQTLSNIFGVGGGHGNYPEGGTSAFECGHRYLHGYGSPGGLQLCMPLSGIRRQ